jgi:FkbM family methyltransferase
MKYNRADYINSPGPIDQELKILFKQNDALTIFEIGACEGEDSIKYSRLFPASKILAFEPLPENIKLIHDNFLNYGVTNASYYNQALSYENGTAEFYVSSGKPENVADSDWDFGNKSSSLLPPARHLEVADFIMFNRKIEVQTITLKAFCSANHIQNIDFLHMDVQGAELMVLQGAGDFLSSIKVIWLEVSKIELYKNQPVMGDVKKFMKENNFLLIKNSVNGIQGDQLYISKKIFGKYRSLLISKIFLARSIFNRLSRKLGISS